MLLFYTRGSKWTWNEVYAPYSDEYVNSAYKHVEEGTGTSVQARRLDRGAPPEEIRSTHGG